MCPRRLLWLPKTRHPLLQPRPHDSHVPTTATSPTTATAATAGHSHHSRPRRPRRPRCSPPAHTRRPENRFAKGPIRHTRALKPLHTVRTGAGGAVQLFVTANNASTSHLAQRPLGTDPRSAPSLPTSPDFVRTLIVRLVRSNASVVRRGRRGVPMTPAWRRTTSPRGTSVP